MLRRTGRRHINGGGIRVISSLMNRIVVNTDAKGEAAIDYRNSLQFEASHLDDE